jgi:phosphoglycolate phosphatase
VNRGLIFDLDGTLVDSLSGIAASLNQTLTDAGLPTHPLGAVKGFIGNGARILIQRAVPADVDKGRIRSLELNFKADYEVTWPDGTLPYDGIPLVLEKLQRRGHPLAVLSNKPHLFTTEIVSKLFPGIHFTAVVGQRDGIAHKPDPLGALDISNSFGLSPADCTIIGDSTMDIETARHAGMRSAAVMWGFQDRGQLMAVDPDIVVEDVESLLELFQ